MTHQEAKEALMRVFENRTITRVDHLGAPDDVQSLTFHLDDTTLVRVAVGPDCLTIRRKFRDDGESVPVLPVKDISPSGFSSEKEQTQRQPAEAAEKYREAVVRDLQAKSLDKYAFGQLRDNVGYDEACEIMRVEVQRRHDAGTLTDDERYHNGHWVKT